MWQGLHGEVLRLWARTTLSPETSHAPPKWEAHGGLKIHEHPCCNKYVLTAVLYMFDGILCSLNALTILVPHSKQILFTGPLTARKCVSVLIKLHAARAHAHEITAQLSIFMTFPLVCHEETYHGPNTSRPTFVNGGSAESAAAVSIVPSMNSRSWWFVFSW